MNAAHIFRQGLGTVPPRANPGFNPLMGQSAEVDELSDAEGSEHRVAHTLTACCRCRQVRFPKVLTVSFQLTVV